MISDFYLSCMGLGLGGLVVQLLLGFGHGSHGSHGSHGVHAAGHSHGGTPHPGGHAPLAGPNHALPAHSASHSPAAHSHSPVARDGRGLVFFLLAPRVWFSLLFGFGAAGGLLQPLLSGTPRVCIALVGAWIFERYLVEPVWNFCLRFASTPAKTLESVLLEEAVAKTNFDANGQGLVSVTLDGQICQMLATLEPGAPAGRVFVGDKLTVTAVNLKRNSCTVVRNSYFSPNSQL